MTEGSGFDSRQGQDIFLLHTMQTGSGAHRASYTMSTRGFPAGEANHSLP
jgi:hypothetical protein